MLGSQPQRIKLDKMIKVRKVEVAVIIVKLIVIDCNENDKNKKRERGREGEVRLNRTGVFKLFKIFIRF